MEEENKTQENPVQSYQNQGNQNQGDQNQGYQNQGNINIPEEYKPLSVGQFIGYSLLMSIPCIGIILIIVFACGGVKNKNVINWARAQLIIAAIILLLYVIIMALGFGTLIHNSALTAIS